MKKFIAGLVIGLLVATAGVGLAAGETVQAAFAKFNFIVNGEAKTLEADPLVYQGTTYLPVRIVSNLLGYDVTFKSDSRAIELVSVGNETRNNEKGDESMETAIDVKKTGRFLVELLAHKYPHLKEKIALQPDGTLEFENKIFNLSLTEEGIDSQPLINAGILSVSDFESFNL